MSSSRRMDDPSAPDDVLVVFVAAPASAADGLARGLIDARVAACVSVWPGGRSIYRWKGAVHDDAEHLLVAKTTRARYAALEAAVRAAHPYEVPEILALPAARGLPEYLAWVAAETREVA